MMRALCFLAAMITANPGWIGIGYTWTAPRDGHKALRVQRVTSGGPADKAGLRPDDLITTANGRLVDFGDDLELALYLGEKKPGDHLVFDVIREGRPLKIDVTLGVMSEAQRAVWQQGIEFARRKRQLALRP